VNDNFPLSHLEIKWSCIIFHLQKECYCNTPLLDLRTEQEVGTLAIKLTLDDHGPKRIEGKALPSTYFCMD